MTPGRYLACIIIFCVFNFSPTLDAQVKDKGVPFIYHYPKQVYLGGTQNWDFAQSNDHILFVANNQGILKNNGLGWEVITMPNRSVVRSLFIDNDGTVYAGAYNEFGYLSPDSTGRLVYRSLIDKIPGAELAGEYWTINRGGDYIYFQSYEALVIYNTIKGSWTIMESESVFGFIHQAGNDLYLNVRNRGLMKIDGESLIPVRGGEFLSTHEVWQVALINGDLLAGTQNDGVFVIDSRGSRRWDTEVNEFLLKNKLFSFVQTEENLFWGSILDGLVVSDNNGNIISHRNKKSGLNNNTVLSMFIDAEESLWMGLDNGIDQVLIHSPLSYLLTSEDIGTGYAAEMHKEKIYLGTNQGLFWIPGDLEKIPGEGAFSETSIPELSGQVWSLSTYGDELLVGHNRGTFSISDNVVKHLYDGSGGWNFSTIPGDIDHILQGTYNGFVVYRRGKEGVEYDFKIEGFNESCKTLVVTGSRNVWMSHGYQGIYNVKLSEDLRRVESYKLYGASSGLGTGNFNELFRIGDEIMAGNPEGVFRYMPGLDDFVLDDVWTRNFREGGRITRIIKAGRENYFYFQENSCGMLRIFGDTLFIKDQEIMAPLTRSFAASFENISFLSENEILIGTENGFAHLDLDMEFVKNKKVPFLFISLKSLRNQSGLAINLEFEPDLSTERDDHPLNRIPYRDNDIRITFGAVFLTQPDQTEYQYFLPGRMNEWSSWASKSDVEFTNLREGEYNLRVRARNIYGDVSEENHLFFHISTPWYRTIIAYISYLLVISVSLLIAWKLINKNLEREKRRTKLLEERRMLHKQMKLKRDSEMAEKEIVKLRNDKLRADIRHKSKELANQTMGILQKNRFLTEIKEEMERLKGRAVNEEVKLSMKKMIRQIDRNIEDEDTHKVFETNFDQVHENFLLRLREAYPGLSAKDLRLCAYLRLNLTSKEIAPLLNISVRGVEISRYRLRKKLKINHEENLADYILRF